MSKRLTMKDLAEELGVSVTTISKAINGHSDISPARRKQILDLLEKRHYVPNSMARDLKYAKSKFVSLIVSDNTNPFFAQIVRGVESVMRENGYHTIISNTNEDPETEIKAVQDLLALNIAGVLITPAKGDSKSLRILESNRVPAVLVQRYLQNDSHNYVVADDVKAGYLATKHLIERHGPRVFMFNSFENVSAAMDRLEGYRLAHRECCVPYAESRVFHGLLNADDGYAAAGRLFDQLKSDGGGISILCFSDYIAIGVLQMANERNLRVPEDVAIMGIDGISYFSHVHPGLSTVYLPKFQLGARAASLLLEMIRQNEGDDGTEPNQGPHHIVLEPRLQIRGTTF